ncbi:PREDICTED: tubulin-specific chaperone C [Nicrophorus vespilloides]|uniref:Tubulin-specific chaperone C n=1 Tax=Nicrophorus vespilloides TaxID=110193 RepID=A0ABM1MEK1_NICVS|nr:PREDICTED: tubulin-specific chaperone C [Nicrophorus vespilloides]
MSEITMQDKLDFLNKRETERKLKSKQNEKGSVENEKVDYFEKVVAEKKSEIKELIEQSSQIAQKDKLAEHFNKISNNILTLQKYIASNNLFLRTYDIKVYQESITSLSNEVKELEDKLLPKKRFNFKKRSDVVKASNVTQVQPVKLDKVDIDVGDCGFKDLNDQELNLNREEVFKKDVALANLENCTVKIYGTPSTLHLSNIKNCKIYSGPVSTSIFADGCIESTLVISCQQLRLHSSKSVNIYLHVTSRAIMEDCTHINVAPYNLEYDKLAEDFERAGLDRNVNNWLSVDDFNWLNVAKDSPNWNQMEEADRVPSFFI